MRILHGILADSSPMDSHRYMGTVDLQWGIFYYSLGAHGESRILRLRAPSTFSHRNSSLGVVYVVTLEDNIRLRVQMPM